ncbi:intermembrane phospholipid transport protein YdbH family protein [Enhydrobacter aerosaccus]|uniref:intermembrane phospholipid transport protein YdbH family protein n=1 Tax=Enhydrobacter aerosaccus TaxID=225324 RepID=UPI001482FD39|nr:YdbH domain-containing protein [Enhydrobacter aerosaccus]
MEKIEIQGMRAKIAIDRGQITIGGHALPVASTSGTPDAAGVGLLVLSDAEIETAIPDLPEPIRLVGRAVVTGPTFEFDGIATTSGQHPSTVEIVAAGKHDIVAGSGAANVTIKTKKFNRDGTQPKDLLPALGTTLPPMDGQASAAGTVQWTRSTISPDLVVHLDRVGFDTGNAKVVDVSGEFHLSGLLRLPSVSATGAQTPADFDSIVVSDASITAVTPSLAAPLRVVGKAGYASGSVKFDLAAKMSGPHESVLEIVATGAHDFNASSGNSDVQVKTMKFHRGSKQPKDLLPGLGMTLPPIDGQASAKGTVHWNGSTIVPDLLVRLEDIAFDTDNAKVSSIDAEIRLSGLVPPSTPPHQIVKALLQPGGLPVSALTLQFQLQTKPAIIVEALASEFADGKISASPFTIDPAHPAIDTALRFSAVNLERVLGLLNIEGVAGTGRLDGTVGLHVSNGKLRIDDSRLTASTPGILRISNRWLTEQLGGSNETVRQATLALNNFYYDTLAIELAQAKNGDGSVMLRLQGSNPAVLQGQKFNFNIKLESNFDRLTEIALRSVTVAHQLLRGKER